MCDIKPVKKGRYILCIGFAAGWSHVLSTCTLTADLRERYVTSGIMIEIDELMFTSNEIDLEEKLQFSAALFQQIFKASHMGRK